VRSPPALFRKKKILNALYYEMEITKFYIHFLYMQAGLFFLKHAEAVGKEIPAQELHEILLLSLQWLSGTMTKSSP
jgi:hypothetical protein